MADLPGSKACVKRRCIRLEFRSERSKLIKLLQMGGIIDWKDGKLVKATILKGPGQIPAIYLQSKKVENDSRVVFL